MSPSPGIDAAIGALSPESTGFCSATAEIAGNRPPRQGSSARGTGSVWLTRAEFRVDTLCFLAQQLVVLLDPSRLVATMHDASRRRADFAVARSAIFAHDCYGIGYTRRPSWPLQFRNVCPRQNCESGDPLTWIKRPP